MDILYNTTLIFPVWAQIYLNGCCIIRYPSGTHRKLKSIEVCLPITYSSFPQLFQIYQRVSCFAQNFKMMGNYNGYCQRMRWVSEQYPMIISSNGNIFRITGTLCGEFTGHQWIPLTKASDADLWCFFDLRLHNGWINNWDAGGLRRHHIHYDITVTLYCNSPLSSLYFFVIFDTFTKLWPLCPQWTYNSFRYWLVIIGIRQFVPTVLPTKPQAICCWPMVFPGLFVNSFCIR